MFNWEHTIRNSIAIICLQHTKLTLYSDQWNVDERKSLANSNKYSF